MVERKTLPKIQSIKILYPNVENMIVVPITKRMDVVMSTQVCLISWINFDYKENERKAFLANPKHQSRDPNVENMIVMPITEK